MKKQKCFCLGQVVVRDSGTKGNRSESMKE